MAKNKFLAPEQKKDEESYLNGSIVSV